MTLYLDTANIKDIQETVSLGVLDGVTTNPSLVAKEGRSFHETLVEICHLVNGPVSKHPLTALGVRTFLADWDVQRQKLQSV